MEYDRKIKIHTIFFAVFVFPGVVVGVLPFLGVPLGVFFPLVFGVLGTSDTLGEASFGVDGPLFPVDFFRSSVSVSDYFLESGVASRKLCFGVLVSDMIKI